MTHVFRDTFEIPFTALQRLCSYTAIPILLLAFACAFVGCDSDDDGDDNSTKDGKNGGQAGTEEELEPDAGDETDAGDEPSDEGISLSWKVYAIGESISDILDMITQPGLEGVEVCLIESVDLPCVYTDEEGRLELQGVPKNSELLLTFTKEGYWPQLVSVKTGTQSRVDNAVQPIMVEKNRIDEELDALGVVLDQGKGHIQFCAVDASLTTGVPGRVSVSIDPPVREGPSFIDTKVQAVADATGFSEGIFCAVFGNLEDGEYVISWEVEEPEKMYCENFGTPLDLLLWGLPTEQPNAAVVKVRAGFLSGNNVIRCDTVTDPAADAG